MPRWVVPGWFTAYGGELADAAALGLEAKLFSALGDVLAKRKDHQPLEETGAPFALRWTTVPDLGFPRAPFEVWRRRRDYKPVTISSTPLTVTTSSTFGWADGMYLVQVVAEPDPGATLSIRPLDLRGKPLPAQRVDLTAAGSHVFHGPGLTGLSLAGRGRVTSVVGVDENELANAAGWVRIDTVGFPFDASEVAPPVYDPRPQGYEPAALTGPEAAKLRLEIAAMLRVPPPAIGVAGVTAPAWDAADPGGYLALLRAAHPAPLSLVLACLTSSDDSDPARIQALYHESFVYPGIRQADVPSATAGDDATFDLPVVGTTMLAASADSAAATGLGYGTIDLPPRSRPVPTTSTHVVVMAASAGLQGFDYMVTASFTVPFFGTLDLAALAEPLPPPDPAANLAATSFGTNRPPTRDAAATESVVLGWDLTARPESFGIVRSDGTGSAELLNTPRPAGAGGYYPFVPQRPALVDGEPPAGVRTTYVDPISEVPLSGTRTTSYFVLGLDVFDRWSSWVQATHTAAAPAVQVPGLHAAKLELDAASASGTAVPAVLVVDVSWDWADRTPDRIELYGTFFPASSATVPDPGFTGGVQLGVGAAAGPAAVIAFDTLGNPSLQAPYTGSVETLTPPPPAGGATPPPTASAEVRRYRIHLHGVSCDFGGADELAYAVTARGAESVRPTVLSSVAGPRVARAPDPLPANPPTLPVNVLWTALPDAAGRARAVLTWPAVAGAAGYFVWEATEAALLAAVGQPAPTHGTPILARAATLQAAIGAGTGLAASLQAFSRMNEQKLTATSVELTLPGAADTIYAYRVSSVTAQGVESARSASVALVAVPRRNQPGTPKLLVRARRDPVEGIEVTVVPGPEPAAAGFRVHRVRTSALAEHLGTMGPAKIAPSDAGWTPRQVESLVGPPDAGSAILDAVDESWYPYYYRAVALGTEDLANGEYAGESSPSGAQSAVLTPALGPLLSVATATHNATTRLVPFKTDLPVRATPVGRATIGVLEVAPTPDGRSTQRTPVLLVGAHEVAEGPALALATTVPSAPQLNRRAPGVSGVAEYTLLLDAAVESGVIVVTDPLGRSLEQAF